MTLDEEIELIIHVDNMFCQSSLASGEWNETVGEAYSLFSLQKNTIESNRDGFDKAFHDWIRTTYKEHLRKIRKFTAQLETELKD